MHERERGRKHEVGEVELEVKGGRGKREGKEGNRKKLRKRRGGRRKERSRREVGREWKMVGGRGRDERWRKRWKREK